MRAREGVRVDEGDRCAPGVPRVLGRQGRADSAAPRTAPGYSGAQCTLHTAAGWNEETNPLSWTYQGRVCGYLRAIVAIQVAERWLGYVILLLVSHLGVLLLVKLTPHSLLGRRGG